MSKKIFFTSYLILAMLSGAAAQDNDPVVMTIGGEPVSRSEFEYNYNKNNTDAVIDRKSVEEYVDMFAVYKMKVRAALDARMDTVASYQKEFRQYRDQQIRPLLVSDSLIDIECRKYYDEMKSSLAGKQLLKPAHILVMLKQHASAAEQNAAKERIDSIYKALSDGGDFRELAIACSDDKQTGSNGGELPWVAPGQLLKEFEDVAYSLDKGQVSSPFLSPVGYHIVKMADRKDLEPFDSLHAQIHRFVENQGIRMQLSQQIINSLCHTSRERMNAEQILDRETERLCAEDENLKYLVQEYHDGLLYYNICNDSIWEPAKSDTTGLEKYFKKNKRKYSWKVPHFNGMVYYCKYSNDVAAVKKAVRKKEDDKWIGIIRDKFNKDSITVKMDKRLFAKGDNKAADKLIFKVKDIEPKTPAGYPYIGYVGRIQKKGPSKWTDISQKVIQDLQEERMKEFVATLRKRYPVVVDEEILKTVNNH
ncbi:MAG: peptidylprolyl isomerase [Bacteroidaceae bacterium]|nr:peptidylprolyl isomerase [Bacteroidaceae bacterium]